MVIFNRIKFENRLFHKNGEKTDIVAFAEKMFQIKSASRPELPYIGSKFDRIGMLG